MGESGCVIIYRLRPNSRIADNLIYSTGGPMKTFIAIAAAVLLFVSGVAGAQTVSLNMDWGFNIDGCCVRHYFWFSNHYVVKRF